MSIEDQIRADLARLSASGDPLELDRWFATNNYTPEQMAAASGYNVDDVRAAQNRASTQYADYFNNELIRKQGSVIDPSSEAGAKRLADVTWGFDLLKDSPMALRQAMYREGIGAGDLAAATGLDQDALAGYLEMSLLPMGGRSFDSWYEQQTRAPDPNDLTSVGPGPSSKLNVGYYAPAQYSGYTPGSSGDLSFDSSGNRLNASIRPMTPTSPKMDGSGMLQARSPLQQPTTQGPGAQYSTNVFGQQTAPIDFVGSQDYNSNLIRSLRAASSGQAPGNTGFTQYNFGGSQSPASGGMSISTPSGNLAFNPQPTQIDEYDPSDIFREVYGRDPTPTELDSAVGKKPADLRTQLEQALAQWQQSQNPQPKPAEIAPTYEYGGA